MMGRKVSWTIPGSFLGIREFVKEEVEKEAEKEEALQGCSRSVLT